MIYHESQESKLGIMTWDVSWESGVCTAGYGGACINMLPRGVQSGPPSLENMVPNRILSLLQVVGIFCLTPTETLPVLVLGTTLI
jgi:hypothetical protein